MLDAYAGHLHTLLNGKAVPLSRISARNKQKFQVLLQTGVIEETRSGAGRSLVLCNPEALQKYINNAYPSGLSSDKSPATNPRSHGIAHFKDSKRATNSDAEILQVRSGSDKNILSKNGFLLPLKEWCQTAGLAAIRLDDEYQWKATPGTIAIIENLEVFLHFEDLGVEVDLICYAAGRLSNRVVRWLASSNMAGCQIIHFGDYDPVGIDEYLRLKNACPGRVKLYIPSNLEQLMAQYGKPALLQDSKAVLQRLRSEKDETVTKLISLMDRHSCGLEQEILLFDDATNS